MYDKIRSAANSQGLSIRQLARKADIAESDMYCILSGKKPFYPKWKERVADALNIPASEISEDE